MKYQATVTAIMPVKVRSFSSEDRFAAVRAAVIEVGNLRGDTQSIFASTSDFRITLTEEGRAGGGNVILDNLSVINAVNVLGQAETTPKVSAIADRMEEPAHG